MGAEEGEGKCGGRHSVEYRGYGGSVDGTAFGKVCRVSGDHVLSVDRCALIPGSTFGDRSAYRFAAEYLSFPQGGKAGLIIFMNKCAYMQIRIATVENIPGLVPLVNSAYRGDGGWTNESHLIGGPRTRAADVEELIRDPGRVILTGWEGGDLAGCVYLQQQGEKLYLGMLSVRPARQGNGVGKALMAAGMEYARQLGCKVIRITVISARGELITWYERQGFRRTGEVESFHGGDQFGIQKQPLEMVVLEKEV